MILKTFIGERCELLAAFCSAFDQISSVVYPHGSEGAECGRGWETAKIQDRTWCVIIVAEVRVVIIVVEKTLTLNLNGECVKCEVNHCSQEKGHCRLEWFLCVWIHALLRPFKKAVKVFFAQRFCGGFSSVI